MSVLIVNGKKILTDQFGYLIHSADWHEEVANKIAKDEALILSIEHWYVIYFLRNFYQQHHKTPSIRTMINQLSGPLKFDKSCSRYLISLFPKGILKQASKLAGLPKPTRCM